MPKKEFDGKLYDVDDDLYDKLESIAGSSEGPVRSKRIGRMMSVCETQSQYADLYVYLIMWRGMTPSQLTQVSSMTDPNLCRRVALAASKIRRQRIGYEAPAYG